MILTDEERKEFSDITKPLIKWLNEHCNPHVTVVVDCTTAELSEGVCVFHTEEFVRGQD